MTGLLERSAHVDMEEIVSHIKAELPDVQCYVEQTGGGTATIYLGAFYYVSRDGVVAATEPPHNTWDTLVPVVAGPGWFAGPSWSEGRADPLDFNWGYDVNDPDPAISSVGFSLELDPVDERTVARHMVRLYREHPRVERGEIR